jgi:hypothetical protein
LPLCIAASALESAQKVLALLPTTTEVEELRGRSGAFQSVLYGVIVGRVPTLREDQRTRLVATVNNLACDIEALRRRTPTG